MPVIFSDFLISNEMSGYIENISTTIFIVHELFLSYKLFKVYRNNMDHPVYTVSYLSIHKKEAPYLKNDLNPALIYPPTK